MAEQAAKIKSYTVYSLPIRIGRTQQEVRESIKKNKSGNTVLSVMPHNSVNSFLIGIVKKEKLLSAFKTFTIQSHKTRKHPNVLEKPEKVSKAAKSRREGQFLYVEPVHKMILLTQEISQSSNLLRVHAYSL